MHTKALLFSECKGDCTLTNYYLDELSRLAAAPGMLKYIANGKLILAGKAGGAHSLRRLRAR